MGNLSSKKDIMHIGQKVVIRENGIVIECSVISCGDEDLLVCDAEKKEYTRKYWEVNKVEEK
jgi:hypothetical protein